MENGTSSAGAIYWGWVGLQAFILVVGIILASTKKTTSA